MTEKKESLKREIGVLGLSANLINIIVGAGIFAMPAIVSAGLGSSGILAYLFCGFLTTLVMLCFAEVGSIITTSGGAYAYIETSFGPYFGFLTVVLFGVSAISADAAVANSIADIIVSVFPYFKDGIIRTLFFFIVFCGLGFINVVGVKEGISLVKLITVTKLAPLLLLALFSWGDVTLGYLSIKSVPTFVEIGKMSLILFFAFQGAESGLSVSGEVKNPKSTIPKAILISISVVLILYIMIQTISQGVLGASLSSFKENPLSEVANYVFGPIGFTLITIGAAVSMFGTLSSKTLSIPRIIFRAAKDKVLPFEPLARVHKKFATPYLSVIAYASLGFIFASIGGFKQLAIISSASMLLVNLGVSLSVIKLRKNNKELPVDGFKIPAGYTIPIVASLIIVWLLSNLTTNEIIGITLFIIALTLVYFLADKLKKISGKD